MKSVGEAMAIGRCFAEALQKALRSLEQPGAPLSWREPPGDRRRAGRALRRAARRPDLRTLQQALRAGATVAELRRGERDRPLVPRPDQGHRRAARNRSLGRGRARRRPACARRSRPGSPTRSSASSPAMSEAAGPGAAPATRRAAGLPHGGHLRRRVRGQHAVPVLELRRARPRSPPSARPKVIILGSGPNRIGQGIEFDYACVHACFALREAGYETVMVNCNPETVSTDYDTSDRLYFEPLTLEDVLEVVHAEQATGAGRRGDRAARRADAARPGAGARRPRGSRSSAPRRRPSTWPRTAASSARCWPRPGCPRRGTARRLVRARPRRSPPRSATRCWSGPSYVLGGRGMEIVYDEPTLAGLHAAGPRRPAPSTRC